MITQNIINQSEKNTPIGSTAENELSPNIQKIISKIEKLTDIGIALSAEKDIAKLLEKILLGAISITNSDGGTIYRIDGNIIKLELKFRSSNPNKNPINHPHLQPLTAK